LGELKRGGDRRDPTNRDPEKKVFLITPGAKVFDRRKSLEADQGQQETQRWGGGGNRPLNGGRVNGGDRVVRGYTSSDLASQEKEKWRQRKGHPESQKHPCTFLEIPRRPSSSKLGPISQLGGAPEKGELPGGLDTSGPLSWKRQRAVGGGEKETR